MAYEVDPSNPNRAKITAIESEGDCKAYIESAARMAAGVSRIFNIPRFPTHPTKSVDLYVGIPPDGERLKIGDILDASRLVPTLRKKVTYSIRL